MELELSMADGKITVEVSTQAAQAELERLRAGIEAALGEINHRAKRESAQWHDMVAKGLDEAADIVRKHTGVK